MNYRHAYHAGNFADCLKHAALVAVLTHLRKKETPFVFIDTHAGRGVYDLGGEEARKTGEAKDGILRLLTGNPLEGTLARYTALVREEGEGRYPGSPLIAAKLLRKQDRLVAIEKHAQEHEALAALLKRYRNCRAVLGDGYAELKKLLPPPERRGCILIDPPFEAPDEFKQATRALVDAHMRFPKGVYLFWYPAKEKAALEATIGELANAGVIPVMKIEFDTGGSAAPAAEGRGPKLTAAGLLAVNPPLGFEDDMRGVLKGFAERLTAGAKPQTAVKTIGSDT
jgi:23S rRNA (adenine2030-N6)-methyltransferase